MLLLDRVRHGPSGERPEWRSFDRALLFDHRAPERPANDLRRLNALVAAVAAHDALVLLLILLFIDVVLVLLRLLRVPALGILAVVLFLERRAVLVDESAGLVIFLPLSLFSLNVALTLRRRDLRFPSKERSTLCF